MTSSKAVFITCFLSLTSASVRAGPVTMKLWSENSTYINITFRDTDFQELYLCLSMDSTAACVIQVYVIYPEDGLVTSIQRRQADDSTRENYFTCTYIPTDMQVVCNRQDAVACMPNTPRTSFRLDNPCCHNSCIWLLWNDAEEQLYGNNTIEVCDLNCTSPVTIPIHLPAARPLNETTLGHEPGNGVTKDAGISEHDHGPSLIVSVVFASIIAVDIIIIIVCVLYKRCHGRGRTGDIKITERETTNTESFRSLAIDLPGVYANTDQTRVYSSLEFLDGAAGDQHVYVKMDDSYKSERTIEEYNKHIIYENTELCKPTEATHNHTNSLDIANKKQRNEDTDRTYSTIGDYYTIMEDLRDESEINRPIMTDFTTENTYVDLHDESTREIYINGDTEMCGINQCYDFNTNDTNIYANTEVCVPGEAQSSSDHREAQSSSDHREAQSSSDHREAQSSGDHREAQSSSDHREAQSSSMEEDNVYTAVTPGSITTRF